MTCLCLLRFVEARNLENRANFQITFKMFGQRVASLVKLYVNLKNFCTARKRSRYEFSGTVLCRTCLSGRKRLCIHFFFIPLFTLILLSKIVCSLCPHRGLTTAQNYCQYLSLAESWYTNVELLYLSVSTRGVIGQFIASRTLLYGLLNSKVCFSRHAKCQRYNKYLTNLVFSVRNVSYGYSFFFARICGPSAKSAPAINPRTDRELCMISKTF